MTMKHQKLFALAIAVLTSATLACGQRSSPTSPTGSNPATGDANPDGSTLKATAPSIVSPGGGIETDDLTPTLTVNNATPKFVSTLQLSYVFEVLNSSNQVVYRSAPVAQGTGGQTSHEVSVELNNDEVHTWRAYAVFQNHRGPMASPASFKTLSRFGVSCAHLFEPILIVGCRMAQHGGMDHHEVVDFLREVAYDMNRAYPGAEFGILVKTTGNNCDGYSCDIICDGNGADQTQYDILIDDTFPNWAEVGDGATIRPCEVIR
jgi:hypothetical protein